MKINCLFCTDTDLTLEHVLPQWIRKYYPDRSVVNKFTGINKKPWLSKPFDLKARIVCKSCNNGWMSKLETQFLPIFNDLISLDKTILDKEKQAIVALWVQKTILMLNQATPGSIKITSELYNEIFTAKKPSRRAMVKIGWRLKKGEDIKDPLASFSIKQITTVDVRKEILKELQKQVSSGGFGWKATLAIGPLVFEIFGHNMKVILEITGSTQVMEDIQPYKKDITWPLEWPIEAEGGLEKIIER